MRDLLARWWAHRKLHRGQCEWCGQMLRDDAQRVNGLYRACSQECVVQLWAQRTA